MSPTSTKEYLRTIQTRYKKVITKKEKTLIINEVIEVLKMHRKSTIRALKRRPIRYIRKVKGKQEIYTQDLIMPLSIIWRVAGKPCSKRLVTQMSELINKLKECNEIKLYGKQEQLLRNMGSSTIDKLLEGERDISKKEYGISGTQTSPLLKSLIPIRVYFTKEEYAEPGHGEMDCVLHCGTSLSGVYAETLNILDISTHWNEKKIFLKKTKRKIIGTFHELLKQFPFLLISIDFDNGFEFVNWDLKHYCESHNIEYTRCRSYHKNDQAHIEGKNYQSIRKVVGYDRIDDAYIITLIDNIYQNELRLLTNFFYTTMKLREKQKTKTGKIIKKYERAKTPYQRVLESDTIPQSTKDGLTAQYQTLNPAKLQRDLSKKLDNVYRLMKQKKLGSSVTELYHATPLPDSALGNT
ncbi:MAG: hypothetical protein WCK60_03725 [Candidatus Nomurabacteria bacterium]